MGDGAVWGLMLAPWHFFGKFLDYPPGYDPFAISKEKMCDPWSEWQGMSQAVSEERAKEEAARKSKW